MFKENSTEEILKMIEEANHEMNMSDDNREQDFIMNKIISLKQILEEKQ